MFREFLLLSHLPGSTSYEATPISTQKQGILSTFVVVCVLLFFILVLGLFLFDQDAFVTHKCKQKECKAKICQAVVNTFIHSFSGTTMSWSGSQNSLSGA